MDEVIKIVCSCFRIYSGCIGILLLYGIGLSSERENRRGIGGFKKGVNQVTDKSNKDIVSDFYAIMGDLYHIKKMNVEAYAAYDSALVYKETI